MRGLLKLTCNCFINPEEISEITISDNGHITVRMKSGIGHYVDNDYGFGLGAYTTVDRLNKEIAALLAGKK